MAAMTARTEPEPARGSAAPVAPGVSRLVAPNPGPMTYHGTNTYLIDGPNGVVVLDPGPDDASHVTAIGAAIAGRTVSCILVSHTHLDHVGAVAGLQAALRVPVAAYRAPSLAGFVSDIPLADGEQIAGLTALHTPGHAGDHLCFARDDGVVFSADHVMAWSTTVVSPPDGDMVAYFASLDRMLARQDTLFLPGHGPPLADPQRYVGELRAHRLAREAAILGGLSASLVSPETLVAAVYGPLAPHLRGAAARSVLAHLLKLEREGRAAQEAGAWRAG